MYTLIGDKLGKKNQAPIIPLFMTRKGKMAGRTIFLNEKNLGIKHGSIASENYNIHLKWFVGF